MPSRSRKHHDDKGLLKPRTARRKAQSDGQFAPHARQNALIQRARQDPGAHAANDILQLQRLIGNQAVLRRLGHETATPIQRRKTLEERATKHQRVAKSKEAIKLLSPKVKDELVDHLFDAKPFGKAVDAKDPQGLHAYKSGGSLPGFVKEVSTKGSKGQVHQLNWKHEKGTKVKSSTMFPSWMPPDHVKTLIALDYSDDTGNVVKEKIDTRKLSINKDDVKTYISHGQKINIEKRGETVFPTK